MLKVGDKVEYLGLCYKITKIDGNRASLRILRRTKNPRSRKQFAETELSSLNDWKGA
jgi:hypothetical protein